MGARRFPVISIAAVFVWGLSACSTPPPAPIDVRKPPPSERINYHVVSKGETLFSLAWRYEKDVAKLASANGLRSPYRLYVGQRLTLDTSRVRGITPRPTVPSTTVSTDSKTTTKPVVSQPKTTTKQQTTMPAQLPASLPSKWRWQWPVPGRVSRHYNKAALFKGIDLQIRSGQPVHAAAPGLVVYAGNGLRGYGELIIIKHSDVFLSAYGHNRKIKVREGQMVKAGQTISEAGGDPANRRRLYFEIRKDGKPVNPLQYLPKK